MDIKTKVKEKFKNKKFKIATIVIVCLVVLCGIGVYAHQHPKMSNEEKDKLIESTYVSQGYNAANKKISELYKNNSESKKSIENFIYQQEQQKQITKNQIKLENSKPKLEDFQILNLKSIQSGNYFIVTGDIKNNGKSTTKYWEVYCDLVDGNKQVIESNRTNSLVALRPNTSNTFKIMLPVDERGKDFNVYVYKVN